MRKGRFSEEQMVAIIREADRDPVAAVAKRHGLSEQTIKIRRTRCCARAANGHVIVTPPSSVMTSRRLMRKHADFPYSKR